MKKLINYLSQKPRIVDILVGLIIVTGLLTLANMRSNFLPPEPVGFISVNVVYRGASPQEVEEEVVNKIEDKLEGIKGIERVTSRSAESFANVRIEVQEHADRNEVLQDINNAVKGITTFTPAMDVPVLFNEATLHYTMTEVIVGTRRLESLQD